MEISFCIAAFFSVLVLGICDHRLESKSLYDQCQKETGVTEEILKGPLNPNGPKPWCVDACMMKKKGIMIVGKAVAEAVIKDVSDDMPEQAKEYISAEIRECVNQANKQEDECEVFRILRDCIVEKRVFR